MKNYDPVVRLHIQKCVDGKYELVKTKNFNDLDAYEEYKKNKNLKELRIMIGLLNEDYDYVTIIYAVHPEP